MPGRVGYQMEIRDSTNLHKTTELCSEKFPTIKKAKIVSNKLLSNKCVYTTFSSSISTLLEKIL